MTGCKCCGSKAGQSVDCVRGSAEVQVGQRKEWSGVCVDSIHSLPYKTQSPVDTCPTLPFLLPLLSSYLHTSAHRSDPYTRQPLHNVHYTHRIRSSFIALPSLCRVTDVYAPSTAVAGENMTVVLGSEGYIQNWNDFGVSQSAQHLSSSNSPSVLKRLHFSRMLYLIQPLWSATDSVFRSSGRSRAPLLLRVVIASVQR